MVGRALGHCCAAAMLAASLLAMPPVFGATLEPGAANAAATCDQGVVLEPALVSRVNAWWRAREERDHLKMYELFEPGFRDKMPLGKYLQEGAVRARFDIVGHCVLGVERIDEQHAKVLVEVRANLGKFGGPYPSRTEEPWVKVDGEWYKVHEAYKLPLPSQPAR